MVLKEIAVKCGMHVYCNGYFPSNFLPHLVPSFRLILLIIENPVKRISQNISLKIEGSSQPRPLGQGLNYRSPSVFQLRFLFRVFSWEGWYNFNMSEGGYSCSAATLQNLQKRRRERKTD
jgi:hypothetical protein